MFALIDMKRRASGRMGLCAWPTNRQAETVKLTRKAETAKELGLSRFRRLSLTTQRRFLSTMQVRCAPTHSHTCTPMRWIDSM